MCLIWFPCYMVNVVRVACSTMGNISNFGEKHISASHMCIRKTAINTEGSTYIGLSCCHYDYDYDYYYYYYYYYQLKLGYRFRLQFAILIK